MGSISKWAWRLTAVASFLYTGFFLFDCILHFLQGWNDAVKRQDDLEMARAECLLIQSTIMRAKCLQLQIQATPLPILMGAHSVADHLAIKFTSALQYLVFLVGVLAAVVVVVLWFTRHSPTVIPYTHLRSLLLGASSSSPSPSHPKSHPPEPEPEPHRQQTRKSTHKSPKSLVLTLPPFSSPYPYYYHSGLSQRGRNERESGF